MRAKTCRCLEQHNTCKADCFACLWSRSRAPVAVLLLRRKQQRLGKSRLIILSRSREPTSRLAKIFKQLATTLLSQKQVAFVVVSPLLTRESTATTEAVSKLLTTTPPASRLSGDDATVVAHGMMKNRLIRFITFLFFLFLTLLKPWSLPQHPSRGRKVF